MSTLKTYGDLFGGFGGATIGAMAAGLRPLWSVEYDADIAAVQRENLGDHVIVASVLHVDPATLPVVDVLHMSPPCPNFSVAKTGATESENDLALARKCAEFIRVIRPKVISLENVYGYRKSQSWAIIRESLNANGYGFFTVDHVNFADYGVPQSRRRMIARAVRDSWTPALPPKQPHIGWYEAIEDLIPTLPESAFAPWQLDRLPDELRETVLVMTRNTNRNGVDNVTGRGVCAAQQPSNTVCTGKGGGLPRAFIVNGTPNDNGATVTVNDAAAPVFTQTASQHKRPSRAFAHGRVVKMTPRALARFQTFPDWYKLPEKISLACRGIGNAVPPLGYQRIIEGLIK